MPLIPAGDRGRIYKPLSASLLIHLLYFLMTGCDPMLLHQRYWQVLMLVYENWLLSFSILLAAPGFCYWLRHLGHQQQMGPQSRSAAAAPDPHVKQMTSQGSLNPDAGSSFRIPSHKQLTLLLSSRWAFIMLSLSVLLTAMLLQPLSRPAKSSHWNSSQMNSSSTKRMQSFRKRIHVKHGMSDRGQPELRKR